jgi:hypothetical protein
MTRCKYGAAIDDLSKAQGHKFLAYSAKNEDGRYTYGSRHVAEQLGIGKSSVNDHRAGKCVCSKAEVPVNSELHRPDGTADYVTMSERAWGYEDFRRFIASKGQDPDKVTFTWGVTSTPQGGYFNKLNNVRPVASVEAGLEAVDLPALYAAARHATPKSTPPYQDRATVIVWADPQIGKTGSRGGTAELIERSTVIRKKLDELLGERNPSAILLADAGDGIEGFESGGNPMFTNDLSLSGQLDTYGTELFEYINLAHGYAPVTVAGIPSNHAAWRCGKQNLGRPSDDLGLFMHKQVQRVTDAAGMGVSWVSSARDRLLRGGRSRPLVHRQLRPPMFSCMVTITASAPRWRAVTPLAGVNGTVSAPPRSTTGPTGSGKSKAATVTPASWSSTSPKWASTSPHSPSSPRNG